MRDRLAGEGYVSQNQSRQLRRLRIFPLTTPLVMKVTTLVIAYAVTYHVVDTYCFPRTGESFIKPDYFKKYLSINISIVNQICR